MRSAVVFRSIAAQVAGLALAFSILSPCQAQSEGVPLDEAALRAEAAKTFKEKVGPFVRTYCTSCHGPRPEAGINLESALKSPAHLILPALEESSRSREGA